MSLGITLDSYANGAQDNVGFSGEASVESLQQLNKALEAGDITGGASRDSAVPGQGAALKVESLERNLKLITFKEQDIRLWKAIPKMAATNTVEEYNQLESYGLDRGGFNNEGELPVEEDSTYVRRAQLVKFMGVTKSVTHPMQLVNTAGVPSAIQAEIKAGTMWILRKVDKSLTTADSTIIPQEFNGLYAQHLRADVHGSLDAWQDSEVVVDLRGAYLTQGDIETANEAILENFGYGSLLFAPPNVLSNFAKDYYEKQRILLGNNVKNDGFVAGGVPKSVSTTVGEVALQHDIFMRKAFSRASGDGATATNAPTNPTAGGTPTSVVAAAPGSRFDSGSVGDYIYAVAAVNRYGESGLVQLGTAVSIIANDAVDLSFNDGGGANPATGYIIYRTKKDAAATSMYPIITISTAEKAAGYDGAAATLVRDKNRFLPDTDSAFLIENTDQVWSFKQLAPLMKMDLAVLSPAYRFMILLYGTPVLYAPKKMVRFINIGIPNPL